jgi:hypothetical protein
MKIMKFFMAALLSSMLIVSVASASELEAKASTSSSAVAVIREQIAAALSGLAVENNHTVFVLFSIDREAGFKVEEVECYDKLLANLVKEELSATNVYVPSGLSGKYLIRVRFAESAEKVAKPSYKDLFRAEIADKLKEVDAKAGSSVKVTFLAKENKFTLKSVEGADKRLVETVENTLLTSKIELPEGMEGNYSIDVKF